MARKLTEDQLRERAIRVKGTGRLTFLHPSKDRHMYIVCQCTCGTVKEIRIDSFERGDSASCGCLAAEKAKERLSTRGGMSDHPLYQAWFTDGKHGQILSPEIPEEHLKNFSMIVKGSLKEGWATETVYEITCEHASDENKNGEDLNE